MIFYSFWNYSYLHIKTCNSILSIHPRVRTAPYTESKLLLIRNIIIISAGVINTMQYMLFLDDHCGLDAKAELTIISQPFHVDVFGLFYEKVPLQLDDCKISVLLTFLCA